MKKLLLRWILCAALVFVASSPAWAQTRVATVDLKKVFDGYWKKKQAEVALKDRQAELTKEIAGLKDDLKNGADEYKKLLEQASDMAVSAEEREKRKTSAGTKLKELRQSEDTIRQFENNAAAQLEQQNRRMRDNIVAEIRNVVKARATSAGYNMVLDTTADSVSATPVVVFASGDNDLTEQVLAQLNANAPLELAKPDDKSTDKKK